MGSDAASAQELLGLARSYREKGLETEMKFLIEQVQRKFPKLDL